MKWKFLQSKDISSTIVRLVDDIGIKYYKILILIFIDKKS
jgi:hypothetical protein